jgi:hypothetical protein
MYTRPPQRHGLGRLGADAAKLLALWLLFGLSGQALAAANAFDEVRKHPAIPLLDDAGKHVLDSGKAYSPKKTCGEGSGCHDYEDITHAFHFQQGRDEATDDWGKKRGVPWLAGPGYFGGYNCMTGSNPAIMAKKSNPSADEFADLGTPGWLKTCGYCHAGGGWGEYDRHGFRYDQMPDDKIAPWDGDYYDRVAKAAAPAGGDHGGHGGGGGDTMVMKWDWKKSGVEEADCLLCHVDFSALRKFPASGFPPNARAKFAASALWVDLRTVKYHKGGLFRNSATAILEFLDVKNYGAGAPPGQPIVSVAKTITNPADEKGYTLDLDAQGLPKYTWHKEAFDANGKITLPMLRFPDNESCMVCHTTMSSRRGFYGYGPVAALVNGPNGVLVDNSKGDVHQGKTWTEANGQSRVIDNCNACHSRNYYNPAWANVELNVNHNFLKGKGAQDVRNDLDNDPKALTCWHCHNDSPNHQNANPSTKGSSTPKNITEVHQERWMMAGDMAGYPQSALERITKTHMDIVGCETCHITYLKFNNAPLQKLFRYREGEKGVQEIVPYKPGIRYLWKDRNSDRVLSQSERNGVIRKVMKADGRTVDYGEIVDPIGGNVLAKVTAASTANTLNDAAEPYEVYAAFKKAMDNLLRRKGYANPDTRAVWDESNQYLISHNMRPSVESVPCAGCHEKKQSGAYSSILSDRGMFGKEGMGLVTVVARLGDRRLFDDGIMELAKPYMKLAYAKDAAGKEYVQIVESVADVLAFSRQNPSMTIVNDDVAKVAASVWQQRPLAEALDRAEIREAPLREALAREVGTDPVFQFDPNTGNPDVRDMSVLMPVNPLTTALNGLDRLEVGAREADPAEREAAVAGRMGVLASPVFALRVIDDAEKPIADLHGQRVVVKLPYRGSQAEGGPVKVLAKSGDGWAESGLAPVSFHAHSELAEGYVAVTVTKPFEALALADPVPREPSPKPSNPPAAGAPTAGSPAVDPGVVSVPTAPNGAANATPPPAPECTTSRCLRARAKAAKTLEALTRQAGSAERKARFWADRAKATARPAVRAKAEMRAARWAAKARQLREQVGGSRARLLAYANG